MDAPKFISRGKFAELVHISPRMASKALHRCLRGGTWRGIRLNVRIISTRGGLSGLGYEVALSSIPSDLIVASERPLGAVLEPSETTFPSAEPHAIIPSKLNLLPPASALPPAYPRSSVTGDHRQASWRYDIISPILETTLPNSTARAALMKETAAKVIRDWDGNGTLSIPTSTLRKGIKRYQDGGLAALMRKARSDAGRRAVIISRPLDRALRQHGLTEAQITEIAARLRHKVRSEWRSGTPSWPTVQVNTKPTAFSVVLAAGLDLGTAELHALCKLPRPFIEAERRYSIIATKEQDASRYYDTLKPTIGRDRSGMLPVESVSGDVHHIDILFSRPDGTICTPKAVAWLDQATNRTWFDIFIMPKGEMIRREHVIESYIAMCQDPNWGVPSSLYIDNGGEYNWTEIITDLGRLKQPPEIHIDSERQSLRKIVQKARYYNSRGKGIEQLFSSLERMVFAQMPGSIGGDRMDKKTQNQGKAPKPFPGDEAQLHAAIKTCIAYYHIKSQDGHLNGLSPNEKFADFVTEGWKSTTLDPWELAVAFSRQIVKPVRSGGTLRLDGTDYRADALQTYVGRKVLVRQPLAGDKHTLFVFTEDGERLAIAQPDTRYAFGDPRGAGEQSRRESALKADMRAMAANTNRLNGLDSMAEVVAFHGPSAQTSSEGVIRLNPEFSEMASMARNAPAIADEETRRKQSERARKSDLLARLAADAERMAG